MEGAACTGLRRLVRLHADTPQNQRDYPQPDTQRPGLGFPHARIAAVFSLACGAILDMGICRYAGKGQSDLGLLRTLLHVFLPGDVMLADRLMCSWTEMVMLSNAESIACADSLRTAGQTFAAAND